MKHDKKNKHKFTLTQPHMQAYVYGVGLSRCTHHHHRSKVHNSYQFFSFLSALFLYVVASCFMFCPCFVCVRKKVAAFVLFVSWSECMKISRPYGYGRVTKKKLNVATRSKGEEKKSKSIFYPVWFESLIMYIFLCDHGTVYTTVMMLHVQQLSRVLSSKCSL